MTFSSGSRQIPTRAGRSTNSTSEPSGDTRELTSRDLAPGTVQTYYAHVSAYIGWCVREGFLEANYAQRNVAKEPLPKTMADGPGINRPGPTNTGH